MNWYNALSPRERNLVLYGGMIAILILFWLLIIDPLYTSHQKYNKIIASQKATLQTMQKQSLEVKKLQQLATKPVTTSTGNPQQLVERSLQTWRLKPKLERMQSQGANGIRLSLKNASADRVVRFLSELETKYNLSISNLIMSNNNKDTGYIDVRLTIKRNKSI